MVRPHRKAFQSNLHGLTYKRLNLQKNIAAKQKWIFVCATVNVCILFWGFFTHCECTCRDSCRDWQLIISSKSVNLSVCWSFECVCTQDPHLPRKVLEMNSDTWFPDRLISDRCVNSRFNILLNCEREGEKGGEEVGERKKNVVSFHWGKTWD